MSQELKPIKGSGWLWLLGIAIIILGISLTLMPDTKKSEPPKSVKLNINSFPSDAEVYLNWKYFGQTPVSIKSQNIKGLLVITKTGFIADYKEVDSQKDETLAVNLQQEEQRGSKNFLLLTEEDLSSGESFNNLRRELLKQGLTTTGAEEHREFKLQMEPAGGISNKALLAWARSKFGVNFLIRSKLTHSSTELSQIDIGYSNIQNSLKGMYKVKVKMEVEVLDMKTGNIIFSFSTGSEEVSVDKLKSLQETIKKVSYESVQKIRREVLLK